MSLCSFYSTLARYTPILLILIFEANGDCVLDVTVSQPESSSQIGLSWTCLHIGRLNEFQVSYQLRSVDQCLMNEEDGGSQSSPFTTHVTEWDTWNQQDSTNLISSHSAMLSGLIPNSSYRITVTSREIEDHRTQRTAILDGITLNADQDMCLALSDDNVVITNISDTERKISWYCYQFGTSASPNMNQFEITSEVTTSGDCGSAQDSVQTSGWTTGSSQVVNCSKYMEYLTVLNGLLLNSTYSLMVGSRIPDGTVDGNIRQLTFTTAKIVPGPVTNLLEGDTTGTSITVTWDAPIGGCLADDYLVRYEINNQGQCSPVSTPIRLDYQPTTQTTITIANLLPYSTYTISVTARNSEGESSASTVTVTTDEAVPTTSLDPRLVAASQDLVFEWTPIPCMAKGGVITYSYELREVVTDVPTKSGMVDESQNTISFTEIECMKQYKFRIRAQTGAGEGPWSEYVMGKTKLEINILLTTPSALITTVLWTVENNECNDVMFKVEYELEQSFQCSNNPDNQRMEADITEETSSVITDLFPHSIYTVFVTPIINTRVGTEKSTATTTQQSAPIMTPVATVTDSTATSIQFEWDELPCQFSGGPMLQYEYELKRFEDKSIVRSSMTTARQVNITNLDRGTEYELHLAASNTIGKGPVTITNAATVFSGPDPPMNVRMESSSTSSLTFRWDPAVCDSIDSDCTISGYRYRLQDSTDDSTITGDTFGISAIIQNLKPCTTYQFRVSASSNTGMYGSYSEEIDGSTSLEAPSPIPLPITVLGSKDAGSSLLVVWQPSPGPCLAESYAIEYRIENVDMCQEMEGDTETGDDVTMPNPGALISDLQPFSVYSVFVTPHNSVGSGIRQHGSGNTSETIPSGSPNNVVSADVSTTSASFTWTEVTCGERRGTIIRYQCVITNPANSTDKVQMEVTDRMVTFDRLQPCSTYIFTVAAVTMIGIGPMSSGTQVTTETIELSAVSALRSSPSDRSTMPLAPSTIQWDPPASGPCMAKEYFVQYKNINMDQCDRSPEGSVRNNVTVTDTNVTLTGLHPHTTYTVSVSARNSAGGGADQLTEIQTEESTPSGPPLLVMSTGVDKRRVSFSWTQPECGKRNGEIVMYSYELTNQRTGDIIAYEVSDTSVTINDLTPYETYFFKVAAINNAGQGSFSEDVVTRTDEDVPPKPSGLAALNTDVNSITIEWSPPDPPHGVIIRYHIEYWMTGTSTAMSMATTNNETTFTLRGLQSNDDYSFRVQGETGAGRGDWSSSFTAQAKEGVPSAPSLLKAIDRQDTSITVQWRTPEYPNGVILKYTIKYRAIEKSYDPEFSAAEAFISDNITPVSTDNVFQYSVAGLGPSTKYEFRVSGITSAGEGEEYAVIEVYTMPVTFTDVPRKPRVESDKQRVTVTFDTESMPKYTSNIYVAVEEQFGSQRRRRALGDTLYANLTRKEANSPFVVGDNKTYGDYVNHALTVGNDYAIGVQYASCTTEECSTTDWSEPTLFTAPLASTASVTNPSSPTVAIVMVFLVIILFIILIVFVVLKRDQIREFTARFKSPQDEDKESHVNPAYDEDIDTKKEIPETRKPPASEKVVAVPPLPSPTGSRRGTPTGSRQGTPTGSRRGTPTCSRRGTPPTSKPSSRPSTPGTPRKPRRNKPIPVDKIQDHINEQTKDRSKGFMDEFKNIPGEKQIHSWVDALLQENASSKNRFINILPYDHSRVKLKSGGDDPVANYINASLVTVYNGKLYIATHGPLEEICADTWQLVWEQKSAKIIMLTNLIEKNRIKCDRYWPEEGPTKYGDFLVTPISQDKFADYTIRAFKVTKDDEEGSLDIKQYHFTDWPDFGVPKYHSPVLNFMKVVNAQNTKGRGPPIVHCSAGVGRTGTYLTIESMIEMGKEKAEVNVPEFVAQIREDRVNLVQTAQQYQFIYEALQEAFVSDDTNISIDHLKEKYTELTAKIKKGKGKGMTSIEQQFEVLTKLTSLPEGDKGMGEDPENADKNRYSDKIPGSLVRPTLSTPGGDENSTNYINAAYIDSRRRKDAFLVTQMPMPTTKGDIWRMIYDHYSYTIVMLNDMDTNDSTIAKYWPDESSSITVGPLCIEFQSSQKLDDVIVGRSFKITNSEDPDSTPRIVLQMQYMDWPAGKEVPNAAKTFLSLVSLVQSHYEQNREQGPIAIHCLDGLGRTGMFCALLSIIDSIKSDQMVDVFQEVKRLRMCRPGMVENVNQYNYLYEVALEHLDEVSPYENLNAAGVMLNGQGESSETESAGGDYANHVVMF